MGIAGAVILVVDGSEAQVRLQLSVRGQPFPDGRQHVFEALAILTVHRFLREGLGGRVHENKQLAVIAFFLAAPELRLLAAAFGRLEIKGIQNFWLDFLTMYVSSFQYPIMSPG